MLTKQPKRGRKPLPEGQKCEVFGVAVLARFLKMYRMMPDDDQRIVRQLTRNAFESAVSRLAGGRMVASDERLYFS